MNWTLPFTCCFHSSTSRGWWSVISLASHMKV